MVEKYTSDLERVKSTERKAQFLVNELLYNYEDYQQWLKYKAWFLEQERIKAFKGCLKWAIGIVFVSSLNSVAWLI